MDPIHYVDMERLADLKRGIVLDEGDFKEIIDADFTLYVILFVEALYE